jgi:hypothetical protein
LTQSPSRFARISNGQVKWIGTLCGNAQGFANLEDFTPHRAVPDEQRVAVFDDSFTSAQFIPFNWPERVEALSREGHADPVTLSNFSVNGAGLANSRTILQNVLMKDRYELDGLVFAVAWDDLDRKFSLFDVPDSRTLIFARSSDWDENLRSRTICQVRALERNSDKSAKTATYAV